MSSGSPVAGHKPHGQTLSPTPVLTPRDPSAVYSFLSIHGKGVLFAAVFIAEASGSPAPVVPGLIASAMAFLVASGISNSESQRSHRRHALEPEQPARIQAFKPGSTTLSTLKEG